MWNNMTTEEKEPYVRMSEEDHSRYDSQQEEMMALRKNSGIPIIKKTRGMKIGVMMT
jgi:hypothetical protein